MASATDIAAWLFAERQARRPFAAIAPGQWEGKLPLAYDVQDRLVAALAASGQGAVAGYKIGLTTPRMQQMCRIDHPIAGAVLATRVAQSPATVRCRDFGRLGVECELAVRLARPLSGDSALSVDRVGESISAIAAAFELIDDRGADYGNLDLPSLVADNSWNAGIVLGQAVALQDVADIEGRLAINGATVDRGSSKDVLGHPLAAVAWLATHLAARGQSLQAGQWVMTGSIVPTRFARPGERYRFSFGDVSTVELEAV